MGEMGFTESRGLAEIIRKLIEIMKKIDKTIHLDQPSKAGSTNTHRSAKPSSTRMSTKRVKLSANKSVSSMGYRNASGDCVCPIRPRSASSKRSKSPRTSRKSAVKRKQSRGRSMSSGCSMSPARSKSTRRKTSVRKSKTAEKTVTLGSLRMTGTSKNRSRSPGKEMTGYRGADGACVCPMPGRSGSKMAKARRTRTAIPLPEPITDYNTYRPRLSIAQKPIGETYTMKKSDVPKAGRARRRNAKARKTINKRVIKTRGKKVRRSAMKKKAKMTSGRKGEACEC